MTKFVNKENNLRARYSLEERKYLVGKWDQPTWNFLNKKNMRYSWYCEILNSGFKFKYHRKEKKKQMCTMGREHANSFYQIFW